jgi:hypothetical protein
VDDLMSRPKTQAVHPVKAAGGSSAHVRAFEKIAINLPPEGCHRRTVLWLVDKGLIIGVRRVIGSDAFGAWAVTDYHVPIHHHSAWCMWASDLRHDRADDEKN